MFSNTFKSLATLDDFALYLGIALLLTAMFARIYTWLTPHDEFKLIKQGNRAVTIAFLGTMIGAILPLVALIRVSASPVDLIVWGVIILIVQYAVYMVCMWWLRGKDALEEAMHFLADDDVARSHALFTGGTGIAVGLLNMGCLH